MGAKVQGQAALQTLLARCIEQNMRDKRVEPSDGLFHGRSGPPPMPFASYISYISLIYHNAGG